MITKYQACNPREYGSQKTAEIGHLTAQNAPIEQNYVRSNSDDGIVVHFKLSIQEIQNQKSPWLNIDGRLTIQVHFLQSYLLVHPHYHVYDNVLRRHLHLMRYFFSIFFIFYFYFYFFSFKQLTS